MFDWNHNGKKDASDSFMDFMIFSEAMNGGQEKQRSKETEPKRDWIDEMTELDAMEDD